MFIDNLILFIWNFLFIILCIRVLFLFFVVLIKLENFFKIVDLFLFCNKRVFFCDLDVYCIL